MFKAQLQAQKAASRAVREMYRYQTRGPRRSSILGPLLVVAAGVAILLIRTGRIPAPTFWGWYGTWWPLVLVVAGLVLVGEWVFDQLPRADGTPSVRRGAGGGAIVMVVVLALTGAAIHGIHDGSDRLMQSLNLDADAFDHFFGEKHEMTQQIDQPFPAGTSLAIDNPHGDVTITGKSGDDQVHITVEKQVYSQSDSDADAKAQRLNPIVVLTGSMLSVSVPNLDGASADVSITVPDFGATTVTANHGDLSVTGMRAPVLVTANHGDINLSAITGAVTARINNRNCSFTAHGITGDMTVRGHADDVSVSNVTGRVALEGEFYGDTHLERLGGSTSFRTSRTEFTFQRLDGEVDISPHSDLTASQMVGPVVLKTRSRNINLDRVSGDLAVVDSDGSVEVGMAPPMGNVSIENKNGEVSLTVPEHGGLTIEAETRGGDIESDLGLKTESDDHVSTMQGTVGAGGPRVTIHTTHLDVRVNRKSEEPLSPAPPSQPEAPKAPPKPAAPVASSNGKTV
jgi:DUF4097 and DUF4098 domain-containing protein YvlB